MKYHYEYGAARWFRWKGMGDPRGYVPRPGWYARADMLDTHPITGKQLPSPQWWARETFKGL